MSDSKSASPSTAPKAKSAAKDVNKSEEIRKLATAMKARGEKPRPVTIVAALKKQGVAVSSPQVSMVLKRMGFRPRKRKASKTGVDGAARKASTVKMGKISVEDLVAAQKVAGSFGTPDKAIAALEALKRFLS
jgi:transposase